MDMQGPYKPEDVERQIEVSRLRKEVMDRITALKAEREPLSGAERGAVTRRITAANEELDALEEEAASLPPLPMDPDEAAKRVYEYLSELEGYASKDRAEFLERAAKDGIREALMWKAEDAVKGELLAEECAYIRECVEARPDMSPFRAMELALGEVLEQGAPQGGLERHSNMFSSGSILSNVCEVWTAEYYIRRLRQFDGISMLRHRMADWGAQVAAWEALQDDEED